jgi:DNA-binding winged helix-turn-helix (wHTH) protein/tetratricopeptide (TPR) repeat protein
MLYLFDDYALDTQLYELRHAGVPCPLEPQVLAILLYLLQHRDRLITRQELLEHVWPERFISETTLDHRVMQVRQAIGDSGQAQRRIQTLRGRGYRFVGAVEERTAASAPLLAPVLPQVSATAGAPTVLVGRAAELAHLQQWYTAACQGRRQVVFVTGEVGIGKTTLVDAFVTEIRVHDDLWVGRGQCIEHHGSGEAYLPLLEAIGQLGRSSAGGELAALLRQYAPSWLLHLPTLVPGPELETLQRRASGVTRERMLRELAEAVEALTATRPLVLVLEDLHWSDGATLDWLAYVARRRETARLLVLGTFRPVEAVVQGHPVRSVTQELQVHGQCAELGLTYFSEAAVATYLARRFAGARLPERFARVLHHRTSGNPLFLVTMVDALVQQGLLRAGVTGWRFMGELATVAAHIPETLWQLLERQVAQLTAEEQALLEAASVAGVEFAVAAVAAAVDGNVDEVEAWCAALARRGQFLRVCGTDTWPDGTVASRYGFLHALYRETLYERVPVGRRVRWHQQIGRRLEVGYEPQARERAVELAEHFVSGRDTVRAIKYLHYAGEQAGQRSAHQEALHYLAQGLTLLAPLPETPARIQQELDLQLALGQALSATKGFAAQEVEQTYLRARALCAQVGDTSQLFTTLWCLCRLYHGRGALPTARELGEHLLQLAERAADPTHRLDAHDALGYNLFYLGEYAAAWRHLEQGIAYIDPEAQRTLGLRRGLASGVMCLDLAAIVATGHTLSQQIYLVLLAEAAGHTGQVEEGLRLIAEAVMMLEANERGDMLAGAYRVQGELLLRHAIPDTTQAEACFQKALTIARRQQAKSWELRVAMSLARLWQQQGKGAAAYQVLAEVYSWFTEGFETADLQEAKALLAMLAGSSGYDLTC